MFADSKPKIPRLREILPSQLVFLDFKTTLEDFFRFGTTDGDVYGDFFVTSDAECADCVAGLACGEGRRLVGVVGKRMGGNRGDLSYCRRVFDQIVVLALWRHG